LYIVTACTLLLCNKTRNLSPKPHALSQSPNIQVSHVIDGCNFADASNYSIPIDTTISDSLFSIYRLSGKAQYFPITLTFTINVSNGIIRSVKWKVGVDPDEITARSYSLYFVEPVGSLTVSAAVEWMNQNSSKTFRDTIVKTIFIADRELPTTVYRGSNTDSQSDVFNITISEFSDEMNMQTQEKIFGIQNLFKGFQHSLPINIYTNGFGICQAPFPYPDRYNINGRYYSQPLGIAVFSANKDSIYINYSFVQYKNAVSFDSIQIHKRSFAGRKV
jgi:hypothetical protein